MPASVSLALTCDAPRCGYFSGKSRVTDNYVQVEGNSDNLYQTAESEGWMRFTEHRLEKNRVRASHTWLCPHCVKKYLKSKVKGNPKLRDTLRVISAQELKKLGVI